MDLAKLIVYLPPDRRHALVEGRPLPEYSAGAVLFADISGFTPLAEALVQELGNARGVEELTHHLNEVYDALIAEVDRYGGSVVSFAGDAITCWLDGDDGRRATACGLALQATMGAHNTISTPSGSVYHLGLKVAIATGTVRRLAVGNPDEHRIDVLAGSTLQRVAATEQEARRGEVILDPITAQRLAPLLEVAEWRESTTPDPEFSGRYAIVSGLQDAVAPTPWPPVSTPPDIAHVRPWLLPQVYQQLQSGQEEFLAELRPAVALFVRFGELDYDNNPDAGLTLDRYIRTVQHILNRYEGTLLQVTLGDKGSYFYAAFGAPTAHEDDTARACHAAWELCHLPLSPSGIERVAIGISRGVMRVGGCGGRTRRTYGVLGDEANLAARLMQHAAPGQILASSRVALDASHEFRWIPLPALEVKGKQAAIPVATIAGIRAPHGLALDDLKVATPMVGRREAWDTVATVLDQVKQGSGHLLVITGEAGIGKSRLAAAAVHHAAELGFNTVGGSGQVYGGNIPYMVWQPIWRALFGLAPDSDAEVQRDQVATELERLDPDLLPRLPLLEPLLGLPLPDNELTATFDPQFRKQSREALLVDILRLIVGRDDGSPLLLVLEDAHWIDALSFDLLRAIAQASPRWPLLLLCTERPPEPGRIQATPSLAASPLLQLPHALEIRLTELSTTESRELIRAKLSRQERSAAPPAAMPVALIAAIAERAQGNPFYIEELINFLHDEDGDLQTTTSLEQVELPTSLQSLVLSRIDRLNERQQIVLKVASIIGRRFPVSWLLGYQQTALGAESGVLAELEELAHHILLLRDQDEPEPAYLFRHVITHEVSYESLPYATRALLHEQLALYLERTHAQQPLLDLLAYHYHRSSNLRKKREYLRRAGDAARDTFANEAAHTYYERLLPWAETAEEQSELLLALGSLEELMGQWDQAEEQYREALALAKAATLEGRRAQSLHALGVLLRQRGQQQAALDAFEQARTIWEPLGDQAGLQRLWLDWGILHWRTGDYVNARRLLHASLELANQQRDQNGAALALNTLGTVAWSEGDYPMAERLYSESLEIRRALGDVRGIAGSLNNLGMIAKNRGDTQAAWAYHQESLDLKRMIGDQWGIGSSLNNLGVVAKVEGNYAQAESLYRESLTLCERMGDRRGEMMALLNLGILAAEQGDYETALPQLHESLTVSRELGERWVTVNALLAQGEIALAINDLPTARTVYWEGLSTAHTIGDRRRGATALIGLAATLIEPDAPEEARLRAATLVSAAEGALQATGAALEQGERAIYERTLATLQQTLPHEAREAAWEAGRGTPFEAFVADLLDNSSRDNLPG